MCQQKRPYTSRCSSAEMREKLVFGLFINLICVCISKTDVIVIFVPLSQECVLFTSFKLETSGGAPSESRVAVIRTSAHSDIAMAILLPPCTNNKLFVFIGIFTKFGCHLAIVLHLPGQIRARLSANFKPNIMQSSCDFLKLSDSLCLCVCVLTDRSGV